MALTLSSHGPRPRTGRISTRQHRKTRLKNARNAGNDQLPFLAGGRDLFYAFLFPSSVFIVSSTVATTFSSPMHVLIMML
jgi:hypothetical protein